MSHFYRLDTPCEIVRKTLDGKTYFLERTRFMQKGQHSLLIDKYIHIFWIGISYLVLHMVYVWGKIPPSPKKTVCVHNLWDTPTIWS